MSFVRYQCGCSDEACCKRDLLEYCGRHGSDAVEWLNMSHFVPRQRKPKVVHKEPLVVPTKKEIEPRFEYDCGHCKLNWNCGERCACFRSRDMVPTPPDRKRQVAAFQAAWRKISEIRNWPKQKKLLDAQRERILKARAVWYAKHPEFPLPHEDSKEG